MWISGANPAFPLAVVPPGLTGRGINRLGGLGRLLPAPTAAAAPAARALLLRAASGGGFTREASAAERPTLSIRTSVFSPTRRAAPVTEMT